MAPPLYGGRSRLCGGGRALPAALLVAAAAALDNGFRVPAMGFSTWYGFTSNIDEVMLRGIADGLVSSGLRDVGFDNLWIDDGYVLPRDNVTGRVTVDPAVFPSGIKAFADYVHARGLKFGIYSASSSVVCSGRPGSLFYEAVDAQTFAEWGVDYVKRSFFMQRPGLRAPNPDPSPFIFTFPPVDLCGEYGYGNQARYTSVRSHRRARPQRVCFRARAPGRLSLPPLSPRAPRSSPTH